ncbi:long-chain fatty acid--CoA ligase [Acuticoccus sp. MNP-M23]|uniref:long-chain fatty acid--CoA ligase n=1 Tax=Acuticoccus sp. MNP-M23 TaxID=3072793 RepID=UPI002814C2A0|nr:long-chain fatty acid--CoA ligase [Acuticoccus sp. MNP-M23]WMS41195.1 long-chain fatty acid--CoA ligase [Acuticoccus sp. MNP-M23]
MLGLMMDRPLRIIDILAYGADTFGNAEIVSANADGTPDRIRYDAVFGRVARLAHGLKAMGIGEGDRVATLAFNSARHFELYYAISGIGAVCHTINPRLAPDEIAYIVSHAEDRAVFADPALVPLARDILEKASSQAPIVALCAAADCPGEAEAFEDLLTGRPDAFDWPLLPENTAAGLCYTSGTTGRPKGALYTHRSTVLHALSVSNAMRDALREGRKVLPAVPLFHVNAWGLPYAAPLTGASLVMPGAALDGASLFRLMDREGVYSAWGVPTIWLGLLAEIERQGRIPARLGDITVGGSAAPPAMTARFEALGVNVCHAWGMTEMSPVGTQSNQRPPRTDAEREAQLVRKAKQGRRLFGVELKIVDEAGNRLPHDGTAVGALYTRGNAVVRDYYRAEPGTCQLDAEGWFPTGDLASIDPEGFLAISDRTKDMIKSGGEWISSIDLENAAMSHPAIKVCAVVAVPHPRWDERPLLIVVPVADEPSASDILDWLAPHFARWQLPDDVVFVEALPLTATGKVSKRTLRQQFAGHVLPGVETV